MRTKEKRKTTAVIGCMLKQSQNICDVNIQLKIRVNQNKTKGLYQKTTIAKAGH